MSKGNIYDVRPPSLKFKKIDDNDDYIEYEVKTYKDSKNSKNVSKDDPTYYFVKDIDSIIFCNKKMKIKCPKPSFMKKNGKSKFAYAFGMFPNPKDKKASYLDGCILGALGLRRQKTNADIICFVTPDIKKKDRIRLKEVFDEVKVVPYISPYDMPGEGEYKTIKMDPELFKNCPNYTKMHPYTHVFFKLHIFNPDLFPYEKVCFVDSDLVPLNYYDSLFMLNTPAGWVENRKKDPYSKSFHWDRCDYLHHGELIPKIFTDIDKPGGADVNAGLLLIEPSHTEYNEMIKELTSPVETWMGPDKIHRGFFTFDFGVPSGRSMIEGSYCYPEQNYLTKRYSGEWYYIEWAFQSWSLDPCNSFGIHMAAFNPKPWFKQPLGIKIELKEIEPYLTKLEKDNRDKDLFSPVAQPHIMESKSDKTNYENITYSYEIFNEIIAWGLMEYKRLSNYFMRDVVICGTKISYDRDIFEPIDKDTEKMLLIDIEKDSKVYKRLTISQKYIYNLLTDYDNSIDKVKGKNLQICKSKKKDRYGNYKYDSKILEMEGFEEISKQEEEELMKQGKMPFGRYKGDPLDELDDDYKESLKHYQKLKENKKLREYLQENLFKQDVKVGTKKKKRITRKQRKKTKRKTLPKKNTFYYFYIPNCKYCKKVQGTWDKLKKKSSYKDVSYKKINGRSFKNREYIDKYNVTSYPTFVLETDKDTHTYEGTRTYSDMKKFIKEHK